MAFAASGRGTLLAEVREAMARAAQGGDDLARMTREVGIPLSDGVVAFTAGRYGEAIERIEPVRDIAHRFGGSHAQRDLITLTLIESALRGGDRGRAKHYLAERQILKSDASRWGRRLEARADVYAFQAEPP